MENSDKNIGLSYDKINENSKDFRVAEIKNLEAKLNIKIVKEALTEKDYKRITSMNSLAKLTHIIFLPSLLSMIYGILFVYQGQYVAFALGLTIMLACTYAAILIPIYHTKSFTEKGYYNSTKRLRFSMGNYSLLTLLLMRHLPFLAIFLNIYIYKKGESPRDKKMSLIMIFISLLYTYIYFNGPLG